MEICEKIRELIEKEVNEIGYEIDEITYAKEDGNMILKISIDKEGLIDLDDCIKVTKLINPIIDEADPIEEYYIMDVCSVEKGSN